MYTTQDLQLYMLLLHIYHNIDTVHFEEFVNPFILRKLNYYTYVMLENRSCLTKEQILWAKYFLAEISNRFYDFD